MAVEVRTHGVGYYQFDKDHESREAQLEALRELRAQVRRRRRVVTLYYLKEGWSGDGVRSGEQVAA